jgi:hypothetical protein
MSKLTNRKSKRQVSKPAPTQAAGAIAAVAAKALPAIGKFVASNPEVAKKGGGVIKNMISKFKQRGSNNEKETTVNSKPMSAVDDFSHLDNLAGGAPTGAPFARRNGGGISVINTGNYDVESSTTVVAGSGNDKTGGTTAAQAIEQTNDILKDTDPSTQFTSSGKDGVNTNTGNPAPDPKQKSTNPNTAANAAQQSKTDSDEGMNISGKFNPNVIGKGDQYSTNHHNAYYENKNFGKKYKFGPKKGQPKPEKWKKKGVVFVGPRPNQEDFDSGRVQTENPFIESKKNNAIDPNLVKKTPKKGPDPNKGSTAFNNDGIGEIVKTNLSVDKNDIIKAQQKADKDQGYYYSDLDQHVGHDLVSDKPENSIRRQTLASQKRLQTAGGLDFTAYDSRHHMFNKEDPDNKVDLGSRQAYISPKDIKKAEELGYKPEKQTWKDGSVHYRIRPQSSASGYRPRGYVEPEKSSSTTTSNPKAKSGSGIVSGSGVSSNTASNVKSSELMQTKGANTTHTKRVAKEAGINNVELTVDSANIEAGINLDKQEAPKPKPSDKQIKERFSGKWQDDLNTMQVNQLLANRNTSVQGKSGKMYKLTEDGNLISGPQQKSLSPKPTKKRKKRNRNKRMRINIAGVDKRTGLFKT